MSRQLATKSPRRSLIGRIAQLIGFSALALLVAYVLFLVVFALGAGEPARPSLVIENQLEEPVDIIYVRTSGEKSIELTVPDGERRHGTFPCDVPRIAQANDGRLVAQWDPRPDCSNDDPWIITG